MLERDLRDGLAQRRRRLPGRHHDHDLGLRFAAAVASAKSPLNVDGSAAPHGQLDRRARCGDRQQRTPAAIGGTRRGAIAVPLRPGRRSDSVEVEPAGSLPTRPSSQPITVCPPRLRDALDREAGPPSPRPGSGGEVDQVPRQVEVEPPVAEARAWRLSLLGTAIATTPPGRAGEPPRGSPRRGAAGARASARRRRPPSCRPSISSSGSSRRSSRAGRAPGPSRRGPGARRASRRVPSPAPTSSTGPGGAIRSIRHGEQSAGPAQDGVASRSEAASGAAGTSRRRRRRARLVGPRVGGRRAARGSGSGRALGRSRRVGSAPGAGRWDALPLLDGRRALIYTGRRRQTAQTSSASASPSSRSSKSSGSIAAARGSSRAGAGGAASGRRAAACPHRHEAPQAQRVPGERALEGGPLLVEELHVAIGEPNSPRISTSSKSRAQRAAAPAVELDVVVGIDDLVRAPQGEAVGRDEHRDAAGLEHALDLGDHPLGIGDVLERLHREHGGEGAVGERQRAHVGDDRLAVLTARAPRRCRRRPSRAAEQVVAVTDPAAEVEDEPGARRGSLGVCRDVALPGRVETSPG